MGWRLNSVRSSRFVYVEDFNGFSFFTLRKELEVLKKICVVILALLCVTCFASLAFAQGTPAGTEITNTATATYNVGSTEFTEDSDPVITTVAELLEVDVTWEDANPVTVNPSDTGQVLTFRVTNNGNGTDSYTLAVDNSETATDDFNPSFTSMYFDTNDNGVYDSGTDEAYTPLTNDPELAADASITVFVLNNIPAGLLDEDTGDSLLTATSNTGTGSAGTVISGAGEDGTNAIVGNSEGAATDTGTYLVSNVVVSVGKSALVDNEFNTNEPIPGAIITYTITVSVTGTGIAEGLVITDTIPSDTTYDQDSLTLNSASLTDAADGDSGDVGGTTTGVVTVDLGDLTEADGVQAITFDVIIN